MSFEDEETVGGIHILENITKFVPGRGVFMANAAKRREQRWQGRSGCPRH